MTVFCHKALQSLILKFESACYIDQRDKHTFPTSKPLFIQEEKYTSVIFIYAMVTSVRAVTANIDTFIDANQDYGSYLFSFCILKNLDQFFTIDLITANGIYFKFVEIAAPVIS